MAISSSRVPAKRSTANSSGDHKPILGLPGRILVSLMGFIVAVLSVTGVVIWWKKRKARARSRSGASTAVEAMSVPAE